MVDSDEEEDSVYAFTVNDKKQEKIEVTVGGCKLNMIIVVECHHCGQANMGVAEKEQGGV